MRERDSQRGQREGCIKGGVRGHLLTQNMQERQTHVRAGPTSAGGRLRDTDGMLGSLKGPGRERGVAGGPVVLRVL